MLIIHIYQTRSRERTNNIGPRDKLLLHSKFEKNINIFSLYHKIPTYLLFVKLYISSRVMNMVTRLVVSNIREIRDIYL